MRPLDGITVLDLTRILSGPYCTMMLADMGARVIKIERPGSGDDTRAWGPPFVGGESSYFLTVNRSKESVAVDFKRPEGRAIVDQLLARADVLVENFRPGTLDAIGLGYTAVAERHPRLIYCSITGYGLTGPQRDRPGYDAIAQAEGGLMSLTGPEGGEPHRLGVAIADMAAGMFAVQGITLAMLALARTGRGQLVDVSLLDSVAALLTYQAGIYFRTGTAPTRTGNRHPSIAPYDTFAATTGSGAPSARAPGSTTSRPIPRSRPTRRASNTTTRCGRRLPAAWPGTAASGGSTCSSPPGCRARRSKPLTK
jgi:formyl-CoA transferase